MIIIVLILFLIASSIFGTIARSLVSVIFFYDMPSWMMMIAGAIITIIVFVIVPRKRTGYGGPYQGNDDAR